MRISVLNLGPFFLVLLLFWGCENASESNNISSKNNQDSKVSALNESKLNDLPQDNNSLNLQSTDFQEIEWTDLIPESDLEALLNPPEYIMQIEDGSVEDRISSTIQNALAPKGAEESIYEQALISTNIIESMDGKDISIPGFIVPVEFGEGQTVTKFFLVPFFGACLHLPPPPPNQIIYVEVKEGVELQALYDPVVASGKLSVELFEDQIATSAYTMQLDSLAIYNGAY